MFIMRERSLKKDSGEAGRARRNKKKSQDAPAGGSNPLEQGTKRETWYLTFSESPSTQNLALQETSRVLALACNERRRES